MQTLTQERKLVERRAPSFLLPDEETVQAFPPLRREVDDMEAARMALSEAERVIRAQEDRIRQLEGLALTDELTGVLNRRGFVMALERELAFARRDRSANGVLLMIDLDGFKAINDHFGHAAGDVYLKAVAESLVDEVREHDIVARLGGDEFAVLLTRIDEKMGAARMKAIEAAFTSRTASWNGSRLPLCASFGMAAYGGQAVAEEIMAEADLRLYASKGRKKAR